VYHSKGLDLPDMRTGSGHCEDLVALPDIDGKFGTKELCK
jgi:hypothetical protein